MEFCVTESFRKHLAAPRQIVNVANVSDEQGNAVDDRVASGKLCLKSDPSQNRIALM
jgi:hypothetical protein